MDTIIYGAQAIALGTYYALTSLYPEKETGFFLVSELSYNSPTLAGLPVRELPQVSEEMDAEQKANTTVWIATPENVMGEIEDSLRRSGFSDIRRVDSMYWAKLMGEYYKKQGLFDSLRDIPLSSEDDSSVETTEKSSSGHDGSFIREENILRVLMAKFYKDRELKSTYEIPEWITPIQVGAALCRERVADILDCEGDNISEKNGNYSELTALYWMWKHCLADEKPDTKGEAQKSDSDIAEYFGLAHYRRILELSKEDVLRLKEEKADVVLPYPMPYEPDIMEHPKRYLKEADRNALFAALKELQPEYAAKLSEILGQQYMYNYNILIAKREVLADYCAWLFPILERTEELSVPKGAERRDRYIGYMGELLCTLYFMYHKNRLSIVHAPCRFLI